MEPLNPSAGAAAIAARCLKMAGLASATWLTPVAHALAREAEENSKHEPAQSVIVLWMAGGPSQLETFDPHPGTNIAGGTQAIKTAAAGVQLADGLRAARRADGVAVARPLAGQQGRRSRARHVPGEDRLPARSDRRASVDRRDLLPRAARPPRPRFRGTFRSCPASGPAAADFWATSSTPSRRAIRPTRCPT